VKNKSWAAYEGLYRRHCESRLGAELVQGIDRQMVIAALGDIAGEVSGRQANKCQTLISSVFSWALDEGKIATHPALRIRKRGVDVRRDRVLSPDEMRRFWAALDDLPETVASVLRLLTLLGARLAEVAEAERAELSLRAGLSPDGA
jgi:integrase